MDDSDLLAAMRVPYAAAWPESDPHANFKAEVAAHTLEDPFATFANLSRDTGIPVGSLVRYVLCRWAASGAEALMAMPPIVFAQMEQIVDRAEADGSDEARSEAFESLAGIVRWLSAGRDMPSRRVS
jgi:hypothetical protein